MRRSILSTLMATIVVTGGLCSFAWSASSEPVVGAPVSDALGSLDLGTLDDTRRWMKVTEQPYPISAMADALCRFPTQADYDHERTTNPHAAAMINVYVNTVGSQAMRTFGTTPFPSGSVIVKEKFYREQLRDGTPGEPSLYTVMVKREGGYNPEAGDWQFAVISGDGKQILAQGQLESCMQCHRGLQRTDHVFGTYIRRETAASPPPN